MASLPFPRRPVDPHDENSVRLSSSNKNKNKKNKNLNRNDTNNLGFNKYMFSFGKNIVSLAGARG